MVELYVKGLKWRGPESLTDHWKAGVWGLR